MVHKIAQHLFEIIFSKSVEIYYILTQIKLNYSQTENITHFYSHLAKALLGHGIISLQPLRLHFKVVFSFNFKTLFLFGVQRFHYHNNETVDVALMTAKNLRYVYTRK